LTEGRGTGIPTIRRVMEKNGSPAPVFETDEQSTYFLTVLPSNPDLLTRAVSDQVSDQVIQILQYAEKPKSRKELLNTIGLKNHFDNYKRHLAPLIENNWLEMTIPDEPNSRNQKYIITEYGKKIIKN
jgi:ATP-dependent DNA helicase RecG